MAEEQETTADDGAATASDGQPAGTEDLGDAGKRALQEERRRARELTSQLKAATTELEKFKAASMTEQERAVAEAEQRGQAAAQARTAGRLARAEFRAAAAGRVDGETLNAYLEDADLSKFVGDDGEPDLKAIEARIKRLGGGERRTDFDGGARSPAAKSTDMNQLIRQKAGLA